MPFTEEWFRSNADATPRQCADCGKTFTIRDDYPWNYFITKRNVGRRSRVGVCPECETHSVLQGNRDVLASRVRGVVRDRDRALFRHFGRDIDAELRALVCPVPKRNPAP